MPREGEEDTVAGPPPTSAGEAVVASAELLAGRYRIVRLIGGGGMGRVYEAHDSELDEHVALKVLRGELSSDALERFRREVKLTRRIVHRNVARMFDIGEHAGAKFLTMELVNGEPLTRRVAAAPLPWPELRAVAEQLCDGLAAAHAAGIVHRDLKPDNVLIERSTGRAVITDFGIARGGDDPSVTQVGAVVGTPRYMSPEQLAGRPVDARSDLFSLGVILYELATASRPWPGDNAVAIAISQATLPPGSIDAPHVPAAFTKIVAACLHLDPGQRPASATLLRDALTAGDADVLDRDSPPTRALRPSKPALTPLPIAPAVPATPTSAEPMSIAVLPLTCADADRHLADVVLEELTDTLSTGTALRVRPAGLATSGATDVREQGRRLMVDQLVTGSLRRTPTGVRITARLIGVVDGFQIWAKHIECTDAEVLATSGQLARGIAEALSARASSTTKPTDPRAVELYLRARAELRRFWGSHVQAAGDLLEKAAEYAPTSGPILAALGWARVQTWVLRGLPELLPPAQHALQRAISTGHGEAFLASAQYAFNRGEPEHGARDLAIALARAAMSAQAHEFAGKILVEIVGGIEARQQFETAVGLDPGRTAIASADLARLDALEGKWESADARLKALLADPDHSLRQLGAVFSARLAAWRGDRVGFVHALQLYVPRVAEGASQLMALLLEAASKGEVERERIMAMVDSLNIEQQPRRSLLMSMQVLSELAAALDQYEVAIECLSKASALGLMDIVWLDACPLFVKCSSLHAFISVRSEISARAGRVLAAFRAA
jgi:serine/threonine-protein kinase